MVQLGIEAAFSFFHSIPPAIPVVLGFKWFCTRFATYAFITLFLKGVCRKIKSFQIVINILCTPVEQGMISYCPAGCGLKNLESTAHLILVSPYPAYPYIILVKERLNGLNLIYITTIIGIKGK